MKPLTGIVKTEPPGIAVAQAQVLLRSQTTGMGYSGQVSATGEFQIERGVPAGSYDVSIFNVSGLVLKSVAAAGARAIGQKVEINGNSDPKLTLVLTQTVVRVEGLALSDDKPFPGAMIVLVPQDPANNLGLFRRDQSDSDGTFGLASVVPGRYTVLAIQNGWELEWGNPRVLKPYMAQGTVIAVEPNGKYDLKVKVQSPEDGAARQ